MYIKVDERTFTVCHDYSNLLKISNVAEFSWSSWGPQPSQKRERNLRRLCSIRKLQLVVVPVRNGYTATVKKCTKKSQKRERNLRRLCSIRKLQLVVVPVRNGYTATVKKCTKKCDERAKLILMAFSPKSPSL